MLPPKGTAENELKGLYRKSHFKGERCGYAAGCEAWLCPAVDTRFEKGLCPRFGLGPMFTGRSPNQGRSPKFSWFAYGRAKPRLTSGGEAVAFRLISGEAVTFGLISGEAVAFGLTSAKRQRSRLHPAKPW